MIELIKKNKKIILSSLIFTGINTNIYCGCLCNNNQTKDNNDQVDKSKNNKNQQNPPKNNDKDETPNVDPLKNIKETLIKFLNSVIENNNNLKENDRVEINITQEIINSKDNKDDLENIEKELNNINNKIIKKINEINKENKKAKMLKLSDGNLSKIKDFLKKYNIEASDDDINKSYNSSYNVGLENCIHLKLKFKYRHWKRFEFSEKELNIYYNFKNDLLIKNKPSINIIYSKELEEKYDCECTANHKNITNKILKENKEYLIKSVYYIRKQDSNFIYCISSDENYYYFYNKEKNDYIDCGYLEKFSNTCYCCWNIFYNKTGTSSFEEIKKNTATIDELLKNVKIVEKERKDNVLSLVTTD